MKNHKSMFVLALGVFFILCLAGVSPAKQEIYQKLDLNTPKGPDFVPGEIIVKFKAGVSTDKIRQINQSHRSSVLSKSKRGKFKRLRIPRGSSEIAMAAAYRNNPDVDYAEPNYTVHAFLTPNDPYYPLQWHLNNNDYDGINVESAWNTQTGTGVIVAVVDSGVAYENFGNKYKKAPDFNNTSFAPGYDFINNDNRPNDDNSHGTHVAGTVAQSTNNLLGVAGVAYNATIMPVKVLDRNGSGSSTAVANGIYYAADNGADVINLSLGSTFPSSAIQGALNYAVNTKGVTAVCAAGNEYQLGNPPSYPAAFADCIAVGATGYNETRAYYSNTGDYLDIMGPGGDLSADLNGDGYGDGVLQQTFNPNSKKTDDFGYWFFHGTSMASPHVAGVAALVIANGVSGPANVRAALESTADDLGAAGRDNIYGFGLVNAAAALNYNVPVVQVHDAAVVDISAPTSVVEGSNAEIIVSVANLGDYTEDILVSVTGIIDDVDLGSQNVLLPPGGNSDLTFYWDTTGASLTIHTLDAQAGILDADDNSNNNSMSADIAVQEARHDVAVTALDNPLSVVEGDTISIPVTVENEGTYAETFDVTLTDDDGSNAVEIGLQSVSLNPGDTTTVTFDWDTTGSSIGSHDLTAEAGVVPNEDVADQADNTMTSSTTVNEASSATFHAAGIDMVLSGRTAGKKNVFTKAIAAVTIVDGLGNPLAGATVSASWSGATTDTDSAVTDGAGQATIESNEIKNASGGTTYTVTVDNVTAPSGSYDPGSNVESSDSITLP